jgi:hypothetical protein
MRLHLLLLASLVACASAPTTGGGAPPPVTFVRSTAESRATRTIDVREGLQKAQAMRLLTEGLEQKYVVEVTDPRAGFVMTSWQASLLRDGVPDLRYRTRITAKFLGDDWRKLQVRDEANWARGEEWDVGFDVVQLDSVAAELQARLGPAARKP